MEALKAIILLAIGFVLLIKGADFFVDGASSVAKTLKVPGLIIGMTVVAMGTSLPELAVSVTASMNNSNTLAVSNVVGSNLFNLMVVLGSSALFSTLMVSSDTLKRDFPFSIVCAAILAFLGIIGFKKDGSFGKAMELDRVDGIIILALFALFMYMMIHAALKARKAGTEPAEDVKEDAEESEEIKTLPMWRSLLYIVGGIVAIKFGGDWVVDGAVSIAKMIGISETLIGLTIVACGTSLPEFVTSIVAARKNELDMAIGNVVGSNIFNILLILGVAATISPIAIITENLIDIVVLIVFSLFVYVLCGKDKDLSKKEGIIMLVLYAVYLVYICMR